MNIMKERKNTTHISTTQKIDNWLLKTAILLTKASVFFSGEKKLHTSRFARIDEMTGLYQTCLDSAPSLLLGRGAANHCLSVLPTLNRRELGNLLVVAPTRGGKGLLAVSQLLTWPHSVVVNDIKGDLFTQTAGYRASLGPVFVIDPTGYGHRYDPLTGRTTEDELLSSATHPLYKPDEGDGAIFTQRAAVMLTQLFLAARKEGFAPLPYVRTMIRDGLVATASRLETLKPELATQFLNVEFSEANLSDRFLLSAWGTLDTRMRPLLTETVIKSLSGTDFRAGDLMTSPQPVTVYLHWPERDLLVLSPLVRLLWGSIIDELIATYDKRQGDSCNPVLLLVDEAGRTAIPSLADHSTTVVGRKISLWIAVQSLSQLETVYGKTRAETLKENMESQIYYRPSSLQTAEYLERSLGKTSEYAHSRTDRDGTKISQGLSEQGVPLLTAQEIRQMDDEYIIGFHRKLQPFRAKRMDWRRFRTLTQRHNLPPPVLPTLPELQTMPEALWQKKQGSRTYIDPDKIN